MSVCIKIIKCGAYCLIADITSDIKNKLEKAFTVRNKNILGYWEVHKFYRYMKAAGKLCIMLPRFASIFLPYNFTYKVVLPQPKEVQYSILAKFMGNQEIVFNELFEKYFCQENIERGLAGAIIKLEAGQGKTFLALHIIHKLGVKAVIVVHNELMLHQWREKVEEFLPCKVGLWYGKEKSDGDVVIAIINSAPTYHWDDVGICIFDEAHLYSSKSRAEIFNVCQCHYMLGLTATPEDKKQKGDNTYKLIQWQIGPILDASTLDGYTVEDIPFTGEVKMIKYYAHMDYSKTLINEETELVSNPKMIKQLIEDPYRIQMIADLVRRNIRPNMNLFIFANSRDYLVSIQKILNTNAAALLTEDSEYDKIMTIMGGSKSTDVQIAESQAMIILTTYQYFGTGKSIPRMNAMILATPFKNGSEQYINRIFRLGSDYSITRTIIDIVDWSTTLKSQWYSRKKYYKSKNYPITVEEAKWVNYVPA